MPWNNDVEILSEQEISLEKAIEMAKQRKPKKVSVAVEPTVVNHNGEPYLMIPVPLRVSESEGRRYSVTQKNKSTGETTTVPKVGISIEGPLPKDLTATIGDKRFNVRATSPIRITLSMDVATGETVTQETRNAPRNARRTNSKPATMTATANGSEQSSEQPTTEQ